MRIIIDTELQTIIVPDSYYSQVDWLNEIIEGAQGNKLDYKEYIRTCFENAYKTQIICQSDIAKMKGARRKTKTQPAEEQTATKK